MPDYVQTAVEEIDQQLRALTDEASRLQAARAALTGTRRQQAPARTATVRRSTRPTNRRNARADLPRPSRDGHTRASQALALVGERPGITIPELANAMKIQPNYLYRVLPRLAAEGQVKRDGQGWHPAPSSTSTRANPARPVPAPRQTAAKAKPTASPTRTARTRRNGASTSPPDGRTAPGATRASVLAALSGGEAMTASEVATKAGLARPTVSTTLSKLAKTGEIQKAERGYQLTSAG